MATWVTHMRIAQNMIDRGIVPQTYKSEFICGSLAPDCGYGTKDSKNGFLPPAEITHFAKNGKKTLCRYDEFYAKYINGKEKNSDYYFYFGYFVHLVTDVLWAKRIFEPSVKNFTAAQKKDISRINTIKKDWYNLDYEFLHNNPDFEALSILKDTREVKDYLPYYEKGQLTVQLRYIAQYYSDVQSHITEHISQTLSQSDVSDFISKTVKFICEY